MSPAPPASVLTGLHGAGSAQRRQLRRDLAGVAEGHGLSLHYQQRLHLGSLRPGAREMQIRWMHRRRGTSPSSVFLPLAAEAGLLTRVGGWALRAACTAAAAWPAGMVSVSVAACQLADGALLGQVAEALAQAGLAPERLELLFAETDIADADAADADAADADPYVLLALSALRDLGVGVAVGDFAARLGSLSLLRRLPLTNVKLSRLLLRGVPACRDDAAILHAVIATAHALGLRVVADGVDSEAHHAFLLACGCDEGQGELFGR